MIDGFVAQPLRAADFELLRGRRISADAADAVQALAFVEAQAEPDDTVIFKADARFFLDRIADAQMRPQCDRRFRIRRFVRDAGCAFLATLLAAPNIFLAFLL